MRINLETAIRALAVLAVGNDPDVTGFEMRDGEAKEILLELLCMPENSKWVKPDLEAMVTGAIQTLGVPAHILGYKYLRKAILLAIQKPYLLDHITKELYPAVAEMFDSTPSRVERAIRHAIEVACGRCDMETMERYYGGTISPSKGKPTNSEFIALVADRIRMQNNQANA